MSERFIRFRAKYWKQISIIIVAMCWATFIVGSQINAVSDAFVRSGVVQLVILTLLIEMSVSASRAVGTSSVEVSGRDSERATTLLAEVANKQLPNADMLEFSGVAVESLIQGLATRGCKVRLLIKHPETVGQFQTRRIVANLEALFGREYIDRVEIRCYRYAASLRGRRLGNEVICLGWYTPYLDGGELARYEVMGHDNALVTAKLGTPEGRHLERMFQGVFESLWTASSTEDARKVIERYEGSHLHIPRQANDHEPHHAPESM